MKKSQQLAPSALICLTIELTPQAAAALKRFAEKVSFEQASAALYPHVSANIRASQAHDILIALDKVDKALADANVHSWPWIDTGQPHWLSTDS